MLVAAVFLLSTHQPDILKCIHDSHKRLVVSKAQWLYIHEVLKSSNSNRVLKLIYPGKSLKVRTVDTSFPNEDGSITVFNRVWDRATVIEKLRDIGGYEAYHPGQTYREVMDLVPGGHWSSEERLYSTRTVMKGAMLIEEVTQEKNKKKDAVSRRHQRFMNWLSPTVYIKVYCRKGRLWLSEISSGSSVD